MVKPLPQEKRKYYRLNLPQPLVCKISIANVGERFVSSRATMVLIQNIGPGGLKFLSNLQFPVNNTLMLHFETRLLGEIVKLHGCVVRMVPLDNGLAEFGVRLFIDSEIRDALSKLLNKLITKMRTASKIPDSDFIEGDAYSFFIKS